ncbi:1-acylglycerol-3-phosphate O [Ramicandelaber brevisporus]|nr:1-acylglycerol-3-phosphate O [Ramicandelaber brevisporus]
MLSGLLQTVVGFFVVCVALPRVLPEKLAFYLRALAFLVCTGIAACVGVIVGPFNMLRGERDLTNLAVARTFYALASPILGITVEVEGEANFPDRPYILVANHQSSLDILWIGKMFPRGATVLAKKVLKYTPILGQFMVLGNAIFIDRSKTNDAIAIFKNAVKEIHRSKTSVLIFPEGTRGHLKEPGMLPFKKGAFHLATQAQIPIVPIVISNMSTVYHSKSRIFRPGKIHVKILAPIDTKGKGAEDVNDLVKVTRESMMTAIDELAVRTGDVRPKRD